jgi:hypothetical protein
MAKRWMGANAQCLWILTRALMEERKYGTAEWLSDCDYLKSCGWRTSDEEKSKRLRTDADRRNDHPPHIASDSDVVCTRNTRPA